MDQSVMHAHLAIDAAYYNALDIRSFALMLKDPSYCYKFYWLESRWPLFWYNYCGSKAVHKKREAIGR
jgi:hypothetical protein